MLIPALVLLCLGACATKVEVAPFGDEQRYWPETPQTKRIAFIGEFSSAVDLGIRESAWSRFVSLTAGSQTNTMTRPMAVAASNDGQVIFVADPDARCVHRYDLNRGRYTCLVINRRESLISPVGIAVTDDGSVYISDSQLRRIFHAGFHAKRLERFELDTELKQPTGVAWDSVHKLLFVTDTGSQSIKAFDKTGALVREYGRRGDEPGEFNYPTYLWFDRTDELLVTDSLNFRVQRFSDVGEFLYQFGENGDNVGHFARPKGIATDSFGHVYVIDALLSVMQVFDREGQFLISIGQQGQGPGEFWLPNGIFISADDTIYIADSRNRRVQVFRYVGPEK